MLQLFQGLLGRPGSTGPAGAPGVPVSACFIKGFMNNIAIICKFRHCLFFAI